MAQATFHFPRGFLWGTATASHQVEGYNTNNNWWAWEQQDGRIKLGHKSGAACDWWGGQWRNDFDRAAEAGQNAHRLSVEWSRIQPLPDKWDESALDRYREMLRGLYDRNMTPMVTLHHFSNPIWFEEMGGWENEKALDYFVPFVRKTVDALREYATYWVTFNEPNGYAVNAYLMGVFPPGKQDLNATLKVMENMLRAHAAAYKVIHEVQPQSRVGIALYYRGFKAASGSLFDRWAAGVNHKMFNAFFPVAMQSGEMHFPFWKRSLPEARGTQDFIGINYYTQDLVAFDLRQPASLFSRRYYAAEAEQSDDGFISNQPEGLFQALTWARRFERPILITENGINDAGDDLRRRFLIQHLHQAWRAVNFNYPIKGYFHWTLVDNFEWERGWTQRFGLWELDIETQARRKRPSADLYAEICRENGISSEMVARYAAPLFEQMFPN